MTAREWQPGDVALVTVDGVERPAVRSADGSKWIVEPQPSASRRVTESARALVVIDPEDEDDRLRLANALHRAADAPLIRTDRIAYALREFANPTPSKPEEPTGLGAVVEDAEGKRWARIATGRWSWVQCHAMTQVANQAGKTTYDDINAVRVLSEGVTA